MCGSWVLLNPVTGVFCDIIAHAIDITYIWKLFAIITYIAQSTDIG